MHCTRLILSESKFYFANMKMIIAATLLGILMHAFAKECELMPAEDNFSLEKYFAIPHVYVTHSRYGPKEKVCREYNTTKIPSGTTPYTVVTSDYKTSGESHHSELKCTNTPKSDNLGQFSVECEVSNGNGGDKIKVQFETSVFATDYKNYALLQSCNKDGDSEDDILVLQTKKNGVDPGVTSVLTSLNWSLDSWVSREKVNCEDIKN